MRFSFRAFRDFTVKSLWRPRFRRIRLGIGLVMALYVGISSSREAELFPFFSWKLFHFRDGQNVRYTLLLEEVKGKRLTPAKNTLDVGGPARILSSIDSRSLVRKLGLALQDKQPSAEEYRGLLETAFLDKLKPIRYQVLAEKYDAASYLTSRRVTWRETLGTFELK